DAQPDSRPVHTACRVAEQLSHPATVARAHDKEVSDTRRCQTPNVPHAAVLSRPCEPGQARWVPCGPSNARRLGPTRAPFHMVLVLHGCATVRTASGTFAL